MIYAALTLLLACCAFAIIPTLVGRFAGWLTGLVVNGPTRP